MKKNLNYSKSFETDKRNSLLVNCKYIMLYTKESLKSLKQLEKFYKLPFKRFFENKKEELKIELKENLEDYKTFLLEWAILIRYKELQTNTEYALPIPQIVDTILKWEDKPISSFDDFEEIVLGLELETKRVFIEEFVYFFNEYQLLAVDAQDYFD